MNPETAVALSGVWKTYRLRERGTSPREVLARIVNPRFRTVEALRGIDLAIARGEIVAIAGPNGAGKSTTVKLLSGLLAPDQGTVVALGCDPIRDRLRYVSRIGVCFGQRTELWWDHPVASSFDWKRVVWNLSQSQYDRSLGALTDMLGLNDIWRVPARELSLGQKMRADLALALLPEPELVILDEPTLGLDVLAKRHVLDFCREINRERRVTIIITSHDLSDLEALAGRMVMVHQGQVAFDGEFDRLRATVGLQRRLRLVTIGEAPSLDGATFLETRDGAHEYAYDAGTTTLPALLAHAEAQVTVLDVETHRPPIDDVIATLYESWSGAPSRT